MFRWRTVAVPDLQIVPHKDLVLIGRCHSNIDHVVIRLGCEHEIGLNDVTLPAVRGRERQKGISIVGRQRHRGAAGGNIEAELAGQADRLQMDRAGSAAD
jgi:hypothetical protein